MRKVLILTALSVEFDAVRRHLAQPEVRRIGPSTYTVGLLTIDSPWQAYVIEVGPGNDATAVEAARGIELIRPELVVFLGVAGGLKDVAVGDVVVATKVYGYETGKDVDRLLMRTEVGLGAHVVLSCARALRSTDWWPHEEPAPRVFVAPIASGEKVVASRRSATYKLLRTHFSDAVAVEMEGRGLHRAAHAAETRAIVVRSISDRLSGKTAAERAGSQTVASRNAAAFTMTLLNALQPEPAPPAEPTASLPLDAVPPNCRDALQALSERSPDTAVRLADALTSNMELEAIAQELLSGETAWLDGHGELAWRVVAGFAAAHGVYALSTTAWERAAAAAVVGKARYLAAAARAAASGSDSERADALWVEASHQSPNDPLVRWTRAVLDNDVETSVKLANEVAAVGSPEERLEARGAVAAVLASQDRWDEALAVLRPLTIEFPDRARLWLLVARTIAQMTHTRPRPDSPRSRREALNAALKARDAFRAWRGPSAEAVALAVDLARVDGDIETALRIALPPPDGEAIESEAADKSVAEIALAVARMSGDATVIGRVVGATNSDYLQAMADARSIGLAEGHDAPGVLEALQRAGAAVERPDQLLAPLYGLAARGAWPVPRLDELRAHSEEEADRVVAAHETQAGQYDNAKRRLRKWHSLESTVALALVYVEAGDVGGAIEVYRDAVEAHRVPAVLVDAFDLAVVRNHPDAWSLGHQVLEMLPDVPGPKAHVRRGLIMLASRAGDWTNVEAQARALIEESAADTAVRWALVVALYNQVRLEEAWEEVLRDGGLVPRGEQDALLLLTLRARFAPGPEAVAEILDWADRYRDSEEFGAAALSLAYTSSRELALPPQVVARLHASTRAYTERFPDSPGFRAIPVQEALAEAQRLLGPVAATDLSLVEQVGRGQLPYGFVSSARGRPYGSTILARAAGGQPAWPANPEARRELASAAGAWHQTVVVDPSSLVIAVLLPDLWERIRQRFHRLLISDHAVRDAIATRDDLAARSTASIVVDPTTGAPRLVETSADDAERLATRAADMATMARQLRQAMVPAMPRFPEFELALYGPWLSGVQLAADEGAALLCDDVALQALAHSLDVPSFGVASLIDAMATSGEVEQVDVERWTRTLIACHVVDLPLDSARLTAVARETEWRPGGASYALSRAQAWIDRQSTLEVARELLRRVADEAPQWRPAWLHACITGAASGVNIGDVTGTAAVLLMAAIVDRSPAAPEAIDLFTAARVAARGRGGGDPVPAAITDLMSLATAAQGVGFARSWITYLLSGLPIEERHELLRGAMEGAPEEQSNPESVDDEATSSDSTSSDG